MHTKELKTTFKLTHTVHIITNGYVVVIMLQFSNRVAVLWEIQWATQKTFLQHVNQNDISRVQVVLTIPKNPEPPTMHKPEPKFPDSFCDDNGFLVLK